MTRADQGSPGSSRAWLLLFLPFALGCNARSTLERSGVVGLAPSSWTRAKTADFMAPGRVLEAWTGPSGSSLCVYQTLPAPKAKARNIASEFASRVENLPGVKDFTTRTIQLGTTEAARIDLVAPGTGDSLAPSGLGMAKGPEGVTLVPTHRTSLGVPRAGDTLWIVWHYPGSAEKALAPEIESTIRGISVHPSASSSY